MIRFREPGAPTRENPARSPQHAVNISSGVPRRIYFLILCLACLAASPARADRPPIESTLARMTSAVLAGDIAAYLACVDPADPHFAQEQKMWAEDLRRSRPTAFSLTLAQCEAESDDVLTADLAVAWSVAGEGKDAHDLERRINFPVSFRFDPDHDRWLYSGEAWTTLETPSRDDAGSSIPADHRARIRFLPGYEDVAQRILETLPAVRDRVHSEFTTRVDRVQEIKLYPSIAHLQASIYLSYVDAITGWNEPGESIKLFVSPAAQPSQLRPLLAHEYTHVVTFEFGPDATDMPWWVLEGTAEIVPEKLGSGSAAILRARARRRVIAWARDGQLAQWDELSDFHTVIPELRTHVYRQGNHMLMFIAERFGRPARDAWLRAMSRGECVDDATTQSLGISFAELDSRWRAALERAVAEADAPKPRDQ